MASKSKKRRRVLGASCILAALIVAGSSFAWFTSKDEVTNRLTANADYGVSIVESFVPPQNMIPGQEVNKDVYAVNTGTIGAFVKETVSGNLTYTYEKRVKEAPTAAASDGYVELSDDRARAIDGATTNEAGGYLAYFKAATAADQNAVELGPVNSATKTDELDTANDPGQVEGDRWHPTKTGTYIFKRSYSPAVPAKTGWNSTIPAGTNADNDALAPVPEKYTYAGYYYVADANPAVEGKYYKIVIGEDPFRAASETVNATTGLADWVFDVAVDSGTLGAGVTVNEKGEIVGDPLIQYVKDVTVTDVTPHLTYHNSGSDASTAWLEAWYTDTATGGAASADYANKQAALDAANAALQQAKEDLLEAQGQAAIDEVAYENALGAYNTAKSRYDQTKADAEYAYALHKATDDLYTAAQNRATAETNRDNAEIAVKQALKAVKDEADALETAPASTGTDEEIAASKAKNFGDLFDATTGLEQAGNPISFSTIFGGADENTGGAGTLNYIINNYSTSGALDSNAQAKMLADVKSYRTAMKNKWAEIVSKTTEVKNALEKLSTSQAAPDALDYNAQRDDGDQAQAYLADLKTKRAELETLLSEYSALYHALEVVASPDETLLTALREGSGTNNAAVTMQTTINNWKQRVVDMGTAIDRASTGLKALVDKYEEEYDKYVTMVTVTYPAEQQKWTDAVNAYNKAVQNDTAADGTVGATKTYLAAINTEQMPADANGVIHKNSFDGLQDKTGYNKVLTDNSADLVEYYSAQKVAKATNNGDPTIDTSNAGTVADLWKTIGRDDVLDHMHTADADKSKQAVFTPANLTTAGSETASSYTKAKNTAIAPKTTTASDVNNMDNWKQLVGSPTAGTQQTLKALYDDVYTASTGKEALKDAAKTTYDDSKQAVTDATAAVGTATTAQGHAQTAADNAAQSDDSSIKFNIYLDDPNDAGQLKWTSALGNGETADAADFYYNYILEPGVTSEKLIDAVKLSTDVKSKDYKSLVFDLNVALDSAQITYEADQKTISTEAVNANPAFAKTAAISAAEADGRIPVAWTPAATDPVAAATTYRVGLTKIDAPTALTTEEKAKTFANGNEYKITVGSDVYWGKDTNNGTKYYKYIPADPDNSVDEGLSATEFVTLSVS